MLKLALTILSATFLAASAVQAGQPVVVDNKHDKSIWSPFDAGNHEIQLGIGQHFSLNNGGEKRPEVNDLGIFGRYGWMLTSPAGDGCFRGNWEFLLDAGVSGIWEGPGEVIVEAALVLRYNFVQPDSKLVPYIQIHAGGAYSDIADEPVQRLIGSELSFNLGAAIGLRYFVSERNALYVEGGWRHISNASTADRNLGLNSIGVQVGYSWFF